MCTYLVPVPCLSHLRIFLRPIPKVRKGHYKSYDPEPELLKKFEVPNVWQEHCLKDTFEQRD